MRPIRPYPKTLRGRTRLLVGGILLLLLITGLASVIAQARLESSRARLITVLRPAQVTSAALTENYVDEATAEREFLLTGNPTQLPLYRAAQAKADHERGVLAGQVGDDPVSAPLLAAIDRAATRWRTTTAEPEIALRAGGRLPDATLQAQAATDEQLFNQLRAATSALQDRITQLVTAESQQANTFQDVGSRIALGATIAAVMLSVIAIIVLRRSLARPLIQLVRQVRRTAGGDLTHSVRVTGPADLVMVGEAVEAMRTRILAESDRAARTSQQLARYAEAERIARDLNETVVQQLFRTALELQSAAGRQPAAAGALEAAVRNIDNAIRDLQSAIFGLTMPPDPRDGLSKRVLDVVGEGESRLGFSPQVRFDGVLDSGLREPVADELIGALRRILTGIAVHRTATEVRIDLGVTDGRLCLRVATEDAANGTAADEAATGTAADDPALAELTERARLLGASCTLHRVAGARIIEWSAPSTPTTTVEPATPTG